MIASLSFCGMSPCMELTVKLASLIFSVSQSTFLLVLQKITAYNACQVSNKYGVATQLLSVTNDCQRKHKFLFRN